MRDERENHNRTLNYTGFTVKMKYNRFSKQNNICGIILPFWKIALGQCTLGKVVVKRLVYTDKKSEIIIQVYEKLMIIKLN